MNDAKKKLNTILKSLCSSDDDYKILEKLISLVVKLEEKEDGINDKYTFEEGRSFFHHKDEKIIPSKDLPESFREIAKAGTTFAWTKYSSVEGTGYMLDDEGSIEGSNSVEEFLEEDEEILEKIEEAGGEKEAFSCGTGSEMMLFNPFRKLSNGEPALVYLEHSDCEWVEVNSVNHLNYKQIFLRIISDTMIDTEYIPEF